jgi:hypothetical protein
MKAVGEMSKRNAQITKYEDSLIKRTFKSLTEYRNDFGIVLASVEDMYLQDNEQRMLAQFEESRKLDYLNERIYKLGIGIDNTEKKLLQMLTFLQEVTLKLPVMEIKNDE